MSLGKILLFVVLLIFGLLALAMTVCGGGFLFALLRGGGIGNGWLVTLAIPLGSIVIGVALLFGIWQAAKLVAKKEI